MSEKNGPSGDTKRETKSPTNSEVVISVPDSDAKLKGPGLNPTYVNQAFVDDGNLHKIDLNPPASYSTVEYGTPSTKDPNETNGDFLSSIHSAVKNWCSIHRTLIRYTFGALALVGFFVYLGFAIAYTWDKATTWCHGTKFLIILTVATAFVVFYNLVLRRFLGKVLRPCTKRVKKVLRLRFTPWVTWGLVGVAVISFVIYDSSDNRYRIVSLTGLAVLLFLGYLFSTNRRKVVWRHVLWGVLLQFVFGLLIIRWNFGRDVFECLGEKVSAFLAFTDSGSGFVYGYLVTGKIHENVTKTETLPNNTTIVSALIPSYLMNVAPVFFFKALSVVIFFSFFISILYYYGVMQILVIKLGWLLQNTMGTTACESMNAAGNIFLGMTEAPLMIQPFLPIMTKSEIHAVMTGGFATIAGSVLAAYINFGVKASHLLSASVMSAPAALALSKLMCPETEVSKTKANDIKMDRGKETNALEAAAQGASNAIALVLNIAANLIAFLAFIAFVNNILGWIGSLVGFDFFSFEWILSKLFIPLSLIMGVEWKECGLVAELIGLKTIVNEFVGYSRLSQMKADNLLSKRAEAIATYALCGFSNIGSIGIQLGALSTMAPDRKAVLASLAVRAMIAGSAACFMTACIAGTLLTDDML